MMSYRNKVIALSSALAILLLIYAGGLVFAPERNAARSEAGRLLTGKATDVASFTITGADGATSLEFSKDADGWALMEEGLALPVQSGKIEAFLAALADVSRLSPRSEGKGDASGFGLGQGSGARITAKSASGKLLADFTVGDLGPTGKEAYVRLKGTGPVYAAAADFASYVKEGRAGWLDLRVFVPAIKPDEVQTVATSARLSFGATSGTAGPVSAEPIDADWTAARKEGGWTGKAGPYDTVAVESVLRSIVNLSGQDIVAMPPADAFAKPQGRIELGLGSGGKRIIEIGREAGEGNCYLRAQGSSFVYLVSAYSLMNALRPESALVKK
jgi:hypothetical protein